MALCVIAARMVGPPEGTLLFRQRPRGLMQALQILGG